MIRPAWEVADVVRRYGAHFLARQGASLSWQQRKAIHDIECCRTAALGGHKQECDSCSHETISYNSCRNRHCPKCQGTTRLKWTQQRLDELLPVSYFHAVFTLPQILSGLALQNKHVMYDLLFRAASETLLEVAANSKHLGARLGFFGVLHTWGQQLQHHPHCHFVIPGGGVSPDGKRWVYCKQSRQPKKKFFLPVKVLAVVFRGKYIDFLRRAYLNGELCFHGRFRGLRHRGQFEQFLDAAVKHRWTVFAKRPFAGPACVVKYLARYTHRVAISNSRLLSIDDGKVLFRWKDYRHGCAQRTAELDAHEFLRRFLQHTLPKGFVRIRHFGFLCNRLKTASLERCREFLPIEADDQHTEPEERQAQLDDAPRCPRCKQGRMLVIETWHGADRADPHVAFTASHRALLIKFDTS